MAFIPAEGIYKVAVKYVEDSGLEALNIFHMTHGIGAFHDNAQAIFDAINAWWLADWKAAITTNWHFNSVEVRDVSVEDGAVEEFLVTSAGDGTNVGGDDALGVAMTVTWQTGFAGKSKRGRSYLVGLPGNSRDTHNWLDATVSGVQIAMQDFFDAMEANDSRLQVVSYFADHAPRTTALITEISQPRCNKPVYRQWRRMTAP